MAGLFISDRFADPSNVGQVWRPLWSLQVENVRGGARSPQLLGMSSAPLPPGRSCRESDRLAVFASASRSPRSRRTTIQRQPNQLRYANLRLAVAQQGCEGLGRPLDGSAGFVAGYLAPCELPGPGPADRSPSRRSVVSESRQRPETNRSVSGRWLDPRSAYRGRPACRRVRRGR
jgi:hypothetical protein